MAKKRKKTEAWALVNGDTDRPCFSLEDGRLFVFRSCEAADTCAYRRFGRHDRIKVVPITITH